MTNRWWIWVGALAILWLPGCGGGRLVPQDIEKMMKSEGGQWALKAIEGHGGIWNWRKRALVTYDYYKLATAHGMDTTITNRRRDTTITPRVDTLTYLREQITLDLDSGYAFAVSASQNPLVLKGFNGDSAWLVRDGVPVTDTALKAGVLPHLRETRFEFSLPFSLLDTTLTFSLVGEEPAVDTAIQKGKEPGTFDTTLTPYSLRHLKVEPAPAGAPFPWLVLHLDDRDGRIRAIVSPVMDSAAVAPARVTFWSDQQTVAGLIVGGRRLSFPADASGQITGASVLDRRYYNVDFRRSLEVSPFTWKAPVVDSVTDSTGT